jgi:hypothetical protein
MIVVPIIARGATLGESGQSLTLHFWRGAKSPAGPMVLPGVNNFTGENAEPNEMFERSTSRVPHGDKDAVKNTGDPPPLFSDAMINRHGRPFSSGYRRSSGSLIENFGGATPLLVSITTIPSVSFPTVKGDDGWAAEQEIGATGEVQAAT